MDIQSVKQRFGIIGTCEKMNQALEVALRVAPTGLSVLVAGESGVGKEYFPQVIHAFSPRKHNRYVAVNCGAIPEGTIDSELFGHEKGAFTGAVEARKGYFEEADRGTIFLDEVAELPLSTQVRLLRVLQTGEFMRVGSAKTQKTDVRVVAATNVDLPEAVRIGKFREDLYYRLNTVPVVVPPLRGRGGDITLLFRKFASDISVQYRMPVITLDDGARGLLEDYYWPGNVRQLKNVAEQISAVESTRLITSEILRKYLPSEHTGVPAMMPFGGGGGSESFGGEREILYRILFDMRNDITEIKSTIGELRRKTDSFEQERGSEIAGLLPSNAGKRNYVFAESAVEAEEEPELTKEQALRDTIVKALQKSGGRRKDAAKSLFISERTLYRKIKELGIENY